MDIWLDTTNIRTIRKAVAFGLLAGVTTNPSLIAEAKRDVEEILKDLLHHQEGPVTVQVVAEGTSEMVRQGQDLYSVSNKLIVKVPVTKNGLEAIHLLSRQAIPTMATAIFHPHQALLAAIAGANYVAPYIGAIEKNNGNPWQLLKTLVHIFAQYRLTTKILGASIHSIEQVMQCAEIGISAITIKDDLFEKLVQSDPLTLERTEQFAKDWNGLHSLLFN